MKISIIIPVYNCKPYVRECIESCTRQGLTIDEYEIIAIDDGSKDGSSELLDELTTQFACLTVVHQQNSGLSATRNKGIAMARGEYVIFIDSDDVLIPDSLACMYQVASLHSLDIVKANLVKVESKDVSSYSHTNPAINAEQIEIKTGEQGFIHDYNPFASYAVINLYRTEFLRCKQLFFLEGQFFEDVAHTIKSYLSAKSFAAIPLFFYLYRQHTGSILSTMDKKKLISFNTIIQYILNLGNELELTEEGKKKLKDSVFTSLSVNLWYISHYNEIYKERHDIINDLKQKVPHLSFSSSAKQRLCSFGLNHCPMLYLSIQRLMAKKRY